jgi:RNA polymerase sigma-70 factor (ECF subfamily)
MRYYTCIALASHTPFDATAGILMSGQVVNSAGRIWDQIASNLATERVGDDSSDDAGAENLAQVVAGCRNQEPAAQRSLVLATQDQVYRLLFRLVGQQDAEDVAQLVYLQVFQRIGQFRGDSSFTTWLYRLTVNEAMRHLRRERSRRKRLLSLEPKDDRSHRGDREEARELLARALEKLAPELRAVFLLREVERLPYSEIAAALEIPMGTVASRLNRAREELQDHLRKLGWDG